MTFEWSILYFLGYFSVVLERPQTKGGRLRLARSLPLGTTSGLCGKGLEFCDNRRSLFLESEGQAASLEELVPSQPYGAEQSRTQQPPACPFPKQGPIPSSLGPLCGVLGKSRGVPWVCGLLQGWRLQASRTGPSLLSLVWWTVSARG